MKITDIVDVSCIRVPLESTEKIQAITELVDILAQFGALHDKEMVLEAVLARERTLSTGIGLQLAVPHGKSRGCSSLVMAIGKPKEPMDFEAADGRPCRFIVLLASPIDKTGPHIQALASITRLWQVESFRVAALEAQTSQALQDVLLTHEA